MMAVNHERVGVSVPDFDRFSTHQVWMIHIELVMDVDDLRHVLPRRP